MNEYCNIDFLELVVVTELTKFLSLDEISEDNLKSGEYFFYNNPEVDPIRYYPNTNYLLFNHGVFNDLFFDNIFQTIDLELVKSQLNSNEEIDFSTLKRTCIRNFDKIESWE